MPRAENCQNIQFMRTLSYARNARFRRTISYMALSIATLWKLCPLSRRLDTMVCMGPVQQMCLVVKEPRSRRRPQCSAKKCVGGIVLLPIRRQVNSMGTQADCFVAETVYEPAVRSKPGLGEI